MSKKKILFLSSRLPYPPIGGDRLKNFWLIRILAKHFSVHLVSLSEEEPKREFYEWAKDIGITCKIFYKSKYAFMFKALKSLISSTPLQVRYYYFRDVQEYIDSIYKGFDLTIATLVRTAKYLIDKDIPKILDMADSIGQNYLKAKEKTKSLKWKIVYSIETDRLLSFEIKCLSNFDRVLFFNKEEMNFYKMPEKTRWLPHGVNEALLSYEKINPKFKNYVSFFGKMNYQPNIDAVLWFVDNVLPSLNREIIFAVVGAFPSDTIKKLEKRFENVVVTGFVDDPYEILKSSICVVAPIYTGGGIQNKVLESMAVGTVNILSSFASKPIGAEAGKDYIVEDNPIKVAEIINDIYLNPIKYEFLRVNSREFIQNNFTWSIYERRLLEIIEEVLR